MPNIQPLDGLPAAIDALQAQLARTALKRGKGNPDDAMAEAARELGNLQESLQRGCEPSKDWQGFSTCEVHACQCMMSILVVLAFHGVKIGECMGHFVDVTDMLTSRERR